ncbi:Sesquipedalian [Balamuthia mandrillaris]
MWPTKLLQRRQTQKNFQEGGEVLKEGYLYKRGEINTQYKLRWFVLKRDSLYYLDPQTDTCPRGVIPIKNSAIRICPGQREGDFGFTINTGQRTFTLMANSTTDMVCWMNHLAEQSVIPSENESIELAELMIENYSYKTSSLEEGQELNEQGFSSLRFNDKTSKEASLRCTPNERISDTPFYHPQREQQEEREHEKRTERKKVKRRQRSTQSFALIDAEDSLDSQKEGREDNDEEAEVLFNFMQHHPYTAYAQPRIVYS